MRTPRSGNQLDFSSNNVQLSKLLLHIRCVGSNAKWLRLTNTLFRVWREPIGQKKGRHVTLTIDDVKVPVPHARYTLDNVKKNAALTAGEQALSPHNLYRFASFSLEYIHVYRERESTYIFFCFFSNMTCLIIRHRRFM